MSHSSETPHQDDYGEMAQYLYQKGIMEKEFSLWSSPSISSILGSGKVKVFLVLTESLWIALW